jgi:hypothetical protein
MRWFSKFMVLLLLGEYGVEGGAAGMVGDDTIIVALL